MTSASPSGTAPTERPHTPKRWKGLTGSKHYTPNKTKSRKFRGFSSMFKAKRTWFFAQGSLAAGNPFNRKAPNNTGHGKTTWALNVQDTQKKRKCGVGGGQTQAHKKKWREIKARPFRTPNFFGKSRSQVKQKKVRPHGDKRCLAPGEEFWQSPRAGTRNLEKKKSSKEQYRNPHPTIKKTTPPK